MSRRNAAWLALSGGLIAAVAVLFLYHLRSSELPGAGDDAKTDPDIGSAAASDSDWNESELAGKPDRTKQDLDVRRIASLNKKYLDLDLRSEARSIDDQAREQASADKTAVATLAVQLDECEELLDALSYGMVPRDIYENGIMEYYESLTIRLAHLQAPPVRVVESVLKTPYYRALLRGNPQYVIPAVIQCTESHSLIARRSAYRLLGLALGKGQDEGEDVGVPEGLTMSEAQKEQAQAVLRAGLASEDEVVSELCKTACGPKI